jgi:acetamidase/formamidase
MPGAYTEGLILPGRSDLLPWDIDIERAVVRLREPTDGRLRLEFPAAPMLGCIGVAPAGDFSPTSGPSGSYGGNMDYWEIREGVEVWLPVYHEGGLLFMGDGHALQGHGEVIGSGVETSMDVEFTVTLRKGARLGNPRIVTPDHIISIGAVSDSSLNRGLQIATTDLARWLESDYGIGRRAVHQLLGMQIRYDVATLAGAVAAKVEKKWLPAPISPRP